MQARILSKSDENSVIFSLLEGEEKVIGRALLPSRDPKCSRNQIKCVFTDGKLEITALGKNPVFVDPSSGTRKILHTDEKYWLSDGDCFFLFADEFPLIFRITNQMAKPKSTSLNRNSSVDDKLEIKVPPKAHKRLLSNDSDEDAADPLALASASKPKRSASSTIRLLKDEGSDFKVEKNRPDTANDEQLARVLQEEGSAASPKKKIPTALKPVDPKTKKAKKKKVGKTIAIDSDDDAPSLSSDEDEDFKPKKKKNTDDHNSDNEDDAGGYLLPAVVTRGEKRRNRRGKLPCMYGQGCYRKSAEHRRQFSHPGDKDKEEDEDDEEEEEEADNQFSIY